MTKPHDGGPAFPRCNEIHEGIDYGGGGMSLRAWLAGMAITGAFDRSGEKDYSCLQTMAKDIATDACAVADALITELETGHGD